MNKTRILNAAKNAYVFSIISKILIVLLGFAYTVCQSRYLGATLKGDVAYISSITQITSIIFCCGIHQAYPYYKKKTGSDVAPFFVKLTALITMLYFGIAILLTIFIHGEAKMIAIFMMTPLLSYNRIVAYINMVETPNKKNATELFVDFLMLIFVAILWCLIPASIFWGIILLIFKDVLLGIIYTYRLRYAFLKPTELKIHESLKVLKYGVFPMLSLLMTTLNYRVDIIMLKQYVTSADVGIYSVGVMLAERVWLIPDALKEVMISNLVKKKGTDEVTFVIRICNSTCIVVILGIILLGQPFINTFFGKEYSNSYSVTVVILIGVVFMIYYKMIGAFNIVEGKQKENFIYLVVSVIVNIIMNFLLIPIYGNIGAALSSVFSYAISAYLFTHRFIKENNVKINEMLLIKRADIDRLKHSISKM